jgi:galactose mutarotase-like enzyme
MRATPDDWIRIGSDELTAAIDPQGAQLSLLRNAAGDELLWNGDPAFWNGRAPILFPIVGTLQGGQYRWRGQRYTLPRHGFARGRRFQVIQSEAQAALLRLEADDGTRQVYPFEFALEVAFRVEHAALTVIATVRNTGAAPMPASLGFHPALRWPLPGGAPRESHELRFGQAEAAPVRRLDRDGLLAAAPHPTPVQGRVLPLSDDLFAQDVLIFDQLRSRAVSYGGGAGPRIVVEFPDATHLGLWTKPGAGFLCIEPWRGVADPAGFGGEFDAKPGVFLVAPGAAQSLTMRIALQAGEGAG